LNPVRGHAHDISVTDMMCETKCHMEQSTTSHVLMMGATS